ncbi:hemerythrin domain-containing protein [Caulobacter sp. 17J80-11]|uniref:hemerythrin domain-containing protein n=1 Tax=Caulobacter sp. 17J80-11 TaxID=2763502 RepID=UPI001653AFD5|nr:hemerythrin domain-containing protein [Caulobacter sp. 17J80-11]MBC6980428.1 hemerythrin domain-containing protein [Caulobacter sp. 17J80-11]
MAERDKDQDALELLKRDHREVEQLFRKFDQTQDENERSALAERVCLMLKVHTQIEEELFYPALRGKLEEEMLNEAVVEHKSAKQLISDIEGADVEDAFLEAKVKVLQEQIQHHVQEEEKEMFPEVRKTDLDLVALGAKLAERKMKVMAQLGAELEIEGEPKSFGRAAERDESLEREERSRPAASRSQERRDQPRR